MVWPGQGSNPQPSALEASTLTITPTRRSNKKWNELCHLIHIRDVYREPISDLDVIKRLHCCRTSYFLLNSTNYYWLSSVLNFSKNNTEFIMFSFDFLYNKQTMKGRRHLRKCVIWNFDLHWQKRGHSALLRQLKLKRACHDLSSDIGYSYMVRVAFTLNISCFSAKIINDLSTFCGKIFSFILPYYLLCTRPCFHKFSDTETGQRV